MLILKGNINDISSDDIALWKTKVSKKRVESVLKKHFKRDRLLSICGDLLVLSACAESLGIDDGKETLQWEENGKPYFKNRELYLSVSHSGDFAVCAVHSNPVGIDIELVRDFSDKILNNICNNEERFYIGENAVKFFEVWTAKEAYSKLCGKGVSQILSGVYANIPKKTVMDKSLTTYHFDNYVYSVVTD